MASASGGHTLGTVAAVALARLENGATLIASDIYLA
jgi:hypothetical protein